MSTKFDFEELKATDRLPSPPGVALSILQLVEREDADLDELAALVQADPALSARLLRFANSPVIAPRRPIVAVREAVSRIGMNGVRNLVLGLSLVGHYRTGECEGFDYPRFWAGSLARAVAAAGLAAPWRIAAPEECFTVGLLGDIGRLALATAWPREYAHCLRQAGQDNLTKLEQERFAIDHRALTCLLLHDWRLPTVFIEALEASHRPPDRPDERPAKLAWLFALARLAGRWCLADGEGKAALEKRFADRLGVVLPELEAGEWLAQTESEWHAWGKLIEIPTRFPKKPQPACRKKSPTQAEELPGLKILLVDDDAILLARLGKQLKQAGHRVETARDGKAALKRILESPPQLVITDWHMRPMDGLTLCRTLRDSPLGERLYLIMLTASETEEDLVRAFDAGIDDYVTKPVSLRVLLARIRAAQRIVGLQEALEREHAALEQRAKELELLNRKLEQLAHTDVLTGLPNRRYAIHRLTQELAESRRNGRPLSVMIVDLDHFKRINDTLGHEAGDRVLVHTARIMRESLRSCDVACRFGGEEFLVIAPDTDHHDGKRLAERLRRAIGERQPDLPLSAPLTASIGLATVHPGDDAKTLLHRADDALYQSKDNGRNRVTVAA
ncbi:MAG TPA: HDOD domain-containing protein [Methylothermaceae bacterium]|nr:HDOD domain-containing protein [Methylothermaceae bacterium]